MAGKIGQLTNQFLRKTQKVSREVRERFFPNSELAASEEIKNLLRILMALLLILLRTLPRR